MEKYLKNRLCQSCSQGQHIEVNAKDCDNLGNQIPKEHFRLVILWKIGYLIERGMDEWIIV